MEALRKPNSTNREKMKQDGDNLPAEVNTENFDECEDDSSGFIVDNDSKASWCMRKIRQMEKKKSDHERLADELIADLEKEIAEIENWLTEENSKLDNNIDFLKDKLRHYAENLKAEDEELKTYSLPYGSFKWREQRDKWRYEEEKLLEFLENSDPDLVRVKKQPAKRKLKKKVKVSGNKAILPTGEIVEGVEIEERGEKFKIDIEQ